MGFTEFLIADDHELFRRELRALLESRPDWRVCGEAIDGIDAVEKAKELRPHVVLMDISMPRMNGIEATKIIRGQVPESRVVLVSQNDPQIVSRQAAEVDAWGYVSKSHVTRDLVPTLERLTDTHFNPADSPICGKHAGISDRATPLSTRSSPNTRRKSE